MFPRLPRTAPAALVVALSLIAVPACKKTKPTEPTPPAPNPSPGAAPQPAPDTNGQREPGAPFSPVFGASSPFNAGQRLDAKVALQQIGLALQGYHDAHRVFPGGYYDTSGRVGLSWRVALLPYLGENEALLFKEFKLDEPWDGPTNKPLVERMPKIYAPLRTNTYGFTFLRGFTGPNTWLNPRTPGVPGRPADGVSKILISDGLSNTILVAEAYDPVIWTKPDELAFTPNNPPRLGGVYEAGAHALTADGAVRFLNKGFSPKVLSNAIQINDGNPVRLDD
jgi:hypothetical protein